ncbi:helix-turn-helix transcriptional regulator [Gottfriedia sp. NPDC058432]|uniref:helix-turn-helix transcriptional regulator n=1 Tax=Gottfriedia sp. NPDC058432 TaxID=3346497 RepID=UPI00365D4B74
MNNRIKELRKAKMLSQDDMAILCGVSRQTINAIENNKYDPTLKLAFKISNVLNSSVDEIFIDNNN